MNQEQPGVGSRVKIVDLLHSHARTRSYARWLLGRCGTVVAVLKYGTVALVELDGQASELPDGVRRWPVHWDHLLVEPAMPAPAEPATSYGTGVCVTGLKRLRHAVPPKQARGLCGEPVRPLMIDDWPMPFAPTLAHTCDECIRLAAATT